MRRATFLIALAASALCSVWSVYHYYLSSSSNHDQYSVHITVFLVAPIAMFTSAFTLSAHVMEDFPQQRTRWLLLATFWISMVVGVPLWLASFVA